MGSINPGIGIYRQLLNPPKVYEVKFSLREIERITSIKMRNFKLWELPKYFKVSRGVIFFKM